MEFSLAQIFAFVSTAEQGSFSAAARKLGKSQSVVSTLVANMEVDLGIDLFSRKGRYPTLTSEGEALLPRAITIVAQCERLSASAESFSAGVETNFCVVIESLIPPFDLSKYILQLDENYPDLNFEVLFSNSGDVPELVRSNRAQLGVMIQQEFPSGFLDFALISSFDYWCVAMPDHPLSSARDITYEQLALHRQVIVTSRSQSEKQHWQISNQVWATDNPGIALDMTVAGIGWSVLPSWSAMPAVHRGQLTRLDLGFDSNSWTNKVDLVWPTKGAKGPVFHAVEKLLRSALTEQT